MANFIAQRFDYAGDPIYEPVECVGKNWFEAKASAIRVMDYRDWRSGILIVTSEGPDFERRQKAALDKKMKQEEWP